LSDANITRAASSSGIWTRSFLGLFLLEVRPWVRGGREAMRAHFLPM
jgi:hypothetical protein